MALKKPWDEPLRGPRSSNVATYIGFEKCAKALEAIENLDVGQLSEVGSVSTIPYIGMGVPPRRPGGEIQFYSIPEYQLLLQDLEEQPYGDFFLFGCKGIGKSCLLRAVTATLIKKKKPTEQFVCIWNFEQALRSLVISFREALMFTYCRDDHAISELRHIHTLKEVEAFIFARIAQGDSFHFVLDGAQILDSQKSSGEQRCDGPARRARKEEVYQLVRLGQRCIYGLSPKAEDAVEYARIQGEDYFTLRSGFAEDVYREYISNNVALAGVCESNPSRIQDIDYMAGAHPMYLAQLSDCILKCVAKPGASVAEVAVFLESESSWYLVKQRFTEAVRKMKAGIKAIVSHHLPKAPGDYYSVQEIGKIDPRFIVVGNDGEPRAFCTQLVHEIYMEAIVFPLSSDVCVSREVERSRCQDGPWRKYCKYLLDRKTGVEWSSVGWLCQHVVEDVLTLDTGLQLGETNLSKLKAYFFTTVPPPRDWKMQVDTGPGVVYLSRNSCYPHVDAVIIWKEKDKLKYHLHGLQLTVNYKRHLHSAAKFMDVTCLQEWIPDILQEQGQWKLHFTFLCCDSAEPVEVEGDEVTMLPYRMEVHSFPSALVHCADVETVEILQAIVEKRAKERTVWSAEAPDTLDAKALLLLFKVRLLELAAEEGVDQTLIEDTRKNKIAVPALVKEMIRKHGQRDQVDGVTLLEKALTGLPKTRLLDLASEVGLHFTAKAEQSDIVKEVIRSQAADGAGKCSRIPDPPAAPPSASPSKRGAKGKQKVGNPKKRKTV